MYWIISLIILSLFGISLLRKSQDSIKQEKLLEKLGPKEKLPKEKGDEFEKFIIKRFLKNKKFFLIKEITSDKGFDLGVYIESNTHPDLLVEFHWPNGTLKKSLAVECKWRKSTFKNHLNWATKKQIERYQAYSRERNVAIFIAIGLGGEPDNPNRLYVIPLEDIQDDIKEVNGKQQGMIPLEKLNEPKRRYLKDKKKGFYYDYKQEMLH